jgi:N-acetylmuramoyl-L-alanine amidase
MKRLAIPLLALWAGLGGQGRPPEMLRVTAVRCWPLGEVTRVAVEISGEFDYHADRAHDPERIYFDVFQSRPWIAGRRIYSADVNDRLVKRVRVAETQPGVTRIVLELGSAAEYTATQLSNPDRLVVELRPAGSPVPPLPLTQPAPPLVPVSAAGKTDTPPKPAVIPPAPAPEGDSGPTAKTQVPAKEAPLAAAKPPTGSSPPAAHEERGRAARMTSDGPSSLTRALGLKIRRVVLDPGHGGHDQGTVGPHGLMEKDLVLDVALRLGKLIESRMGSEVVFTRTDDTFIPLEGRTALANEKKADLFLSIHANSSAYPRIGGVETYYLNFTNSKDALAVAARENASSDKSVFELRDLIQKITLQDKAEESKEFAGRIQASLFAFAARYNPGIKNRGVKKAPFVVLIGASMPSVLAEIGFLSNPREEALLKKPQHRQKLAEALYRGVYRYAQSLSHFQMAQARDGVKN